MFEIELTPILIALFSGLIFCILYLLLGFRRYVSSVSARVAECNEMALPAHEGAYPAVSVIVFSEDDAENLEVLLPQILEQDYPGRFEVIVVNDGAVSSTKDVIARLERRYSNLYMTFTPMESRSLSRKKLAITLGIKAARYEVVVLTTGDCRIESPTWLSTMCRHFADGKEVVIGYAAQLIPDGVANPHKRLHAFDSVRTAVEYLSWAIAGRPFRGIGHNLAYRRALFFKNKGFSRSLNLKFGDDDIFINEVTDSHNTYVELSTASIVEVLDKYPDLSHKSNKLRYAFTSRHIRTSARLFFGSCSLFWWLMLGLTVAVSIVGLPSLIPFIVSVVLLLTTIIILMTAWRRTSLSLGSRAILLTFPFLMSFEPLYNFFYRLKGLRGKGANLT